MTTKIRIKSLPLHKLLKYNMDSRQLTNLLSFIAANYEVRHSTGARLKPEFTKKLLLNKFSSLTEAQINHILRII